MEQYDFLPIFPKSWQIIKFIEKIPRIIFWRVRLCLRKYFYSASSEYQTNQWHQRKSGSSDAMKRQIPLNDRSVCFPFQARVQMNDIWYGEIAEKRYFS